MKRMLINATQPEELRVAIAEGQYLFDLDIEVPSQEQKKSNVYKGRITRVEPSLEACFVDFGSSRHGFLPLKEICESRYGKDARKKDGRVAIRDAVHEGQEIIIQVEKEERSNKGAALTTYISLAGRYLVLMPTNPTAGGVSRRITGDDRAHLREQLQQVSTPDNVGIIVRTAGVGKDAAELQWDLDYQLQLWAAIEQAAAKRSAPFLIYQESNLFIRALRDHLRNDIGEILIDNEKVFNDAREFVQQVMPHNLNKLKFYTDPVPLFNRYQIESQIESAFARTVHLPSGGAVVIDHTEALLSIDINSARATKGSDIEETAYNTNMESANEIARQLRLRDLGGLIVIDFIDMTSRKHQRKVEECLRRAMEVDKARVQIGRISRFGLLEMSRQRLRPSLGESSLETCPRCDGHGHIRSVESLALSILRLLEEEAMKDHTGQIIIQAPTEVVNFLHNEKRSILAEAETRHQVSIVVIANQHLVTPHFEILRIKESEVTADASYERVKQPEAQLVANEHSQANVVAVPAPAVERIMPSQPTPVHRKAKTPGLFTRLANSLFSGSAEDQQSQPVKRITSKKKTTNRRGTQGHSRRNTRSSGQQTQRKPSKKNASKAGQSGGKQQQAKRQTGQQRVSGKQQGAKQASSRTTQNKAGQTGARQASSNQKQAQAPRSRSASADKKQPDNAEVSTSATTSSAQADATASSNVAETASQPEKKQKSRNKSGRRRRSPYKTGGSKSRPERNEAKAAQQTVTDNKQNTAAKDSQNAVKKPEKSSQPEPARSTPAKPTKSSAQPKDSQPTKPRQAKVKPVELTQVDSPSKNPDSSSKPAGKVVSKTATKKKPTTRKAATSAEKPSKTKSGTTRKKTASKSATPKKSKAVAKPAPQPQKGPKGLYTLQPETTKNPAGANSED